MKKQFGCCVRTYTPVVAFVSFLFPFFPKRTLTRSITHQDKGESCSHSWRDIFLQEKKSRLMKLTTFLHSRIIFYHRVSPVNDLDLFMYIVVVECWNVVPSNLINILDFVQRMRVERLNGYISLYRDLGDATAATEEADSNYHSASQESEDERWALNSSSCGSTIRYVR